MKQKLLALLFALSFVLVGCAGQQAASGEKGASTETSTASTASEDAQNGADFEVGIYEINQYGNIMLDVESDSATSCSMSNRIP